MVRFCSLCWYIMCDLHTLYDLHEPRLLQRARVSSYPFPKKTLLRTHFVSHENDMSPCPFLPAQTRPRGFMNTRVSVRSIASHAFVSTARPPHPSRRCSTRTNASPTRMGPPMPSVALGRVLPGGENAKVTLAAWLDYACPFSATAYKTLVTEVGPRYGQDLRLEFFHQVQPWHPQSTMLHEAAVAVFQLAGPGAFFQFSSALFELQVEFFDANTYHKSRMEIYEELALLGSLSVDGLREEDIMSKLERVVATDGSLNTGNATTRDLKFHVKLARQNGIHVSPTTTLNGMVCDTDSSWTLGQWETFLDPHVARAALSQ